MKYILFMLLCLVAPLHAYDKSEVVTAVILAEAGGEGNKGMHGVASVIANRMVTRKLAPFEVVSQRSQFAPLSIVIIDEKMTYEEFVAKYRKHKKWDEARKLTREIYYGTLEDVTQGSSHFHPVNSKPYWAEKIEFKVKIGNHLFYKENL